MRTVYSKTPKGGRAENDFYATDPIAAKLLLNVEKFDQDIWECASGENHLADVFKEYGYNVRTSDIVKRTPTTEKRDFLRTRKKWHGDIITNPPYDLALEFVEKSLSLVSEGHKVAMFLRLQFLEGIKRYPLFRDNPPKTVYVASRRIKCGKDGDVDSSTFNIQCYAWFVWEKGYKGKPCLDFINHDEELDESRMMFDCQWDKSVYDGSEALEKKKIKLYLGNCLEHLRRLPSNSVNLELTSPPYDSLRTYGGNMTWNLEIFKAIAREMVRVLKPGGVIIWNVCDQCMKGSYSANSLRQVLYFTEELGLNLHDTMVWHKPNPFGRKRGKRYQAAFEPMYVFSKGEPETFNPIMRKCKNGGKAYKAIYRSMRYDGRVEYKEGFVNEEVADYNVWSIQQAKNREKFITKDGRQIKHPAVFPKELVLRHIQTWTKEGDIVLDPFLGSGTTGIAAVELGRKFIGCELNEDYFDMASARIEARMQELGISNEVVDAPRARIICLWNQNATDAACIVRSLYLKATGTDGYSSQVGIEGDKIASTYPLMYQNAAACGFQATSCQTLIVAMPTVSWRVGEYEMQQCMPRGTPPNHILQRQSDIMFLKI